MATIQNKRRQGETTAAQGNTQGSGGRLQLIPGCRSGNAQAWDDSLVPAQRKAQLGSKARRALSPPALHTASDPRARWPPRRGVAGGRWRSCAACKARHGERWDQRQHSGSRSQCSCTGRTMAQPRPAGATVAALINTAEAPPGRLTFAWAW